MDSLHSRETDKNKDSSRSGPEMDRGLATGASDAASTMEQAKTVARNVGEQARNMASNATATAQDLARRAREQTDTLYQQGAQAGEYLTRNVNEYPLMALLIAGAVGYGLGYLIHSSWTTDGWDGGERRDRDGRD
jgi:ElaB/YqjD/DUF883 family membrane-anchored ribosome-binding protein